MTALKQYARLECPGVWRPDPDVQRQNVIVSFGDASLVIADQKGMALSHWSLAAVVRVNRGEMPALYTPSAEGTETLEIDDETMIDAIEQVRGAIQKSRPRRGRLRLLLLAGLGAGMLAAGALWLPGALLRHTLSVVPEPTRIEIGTRLFTAIGRVSGAPCRSPRGDQALARLSSRLLAPGGGGLLVVPGGIPDTISLPGGAMLVHSRLVEDHETPDVVAGFILAEDVRRGLHDPLADLLRGAGPGAIFRLLTTGHLPDAALRDYAETLTAATPERVPDALLITRFEQAALPSTPYAYALDVTGETTLNLIEADPMRGGGARTVLDDGDWVALQGICGS
ncbi:hypothetical protein [Tropicimonas sediminicola]|uniref:Uncharacterized protein n=1 Tax=Tropicimonas sediminicola TaxID=1031541 RepID=A0A239M9H7_9RHOB|nr:hypothetical protein [Tropicimonas sediminicola]SNT38654.1 hypothetical protein SAMN05421757_11419 [Tropicimonas sediminicola]